MAGAALAGAGRWRWWVYAGLLAASVTAVPGSSAWFRGGLILYADDLKVALAGVPEALLREHGAVSEPVARALAEAGRTRLQADCCLSITGIAGPGGGSAQKPVGLVFVGLATAERTEVKRLHLPGDRELVRRRAAVVALDLLRRRLP